MIMNMKRYIVAGIMAVALLTSGCGKFVRDELITMQNEMDRLHEQYEQINGELSRLRSIVNLMASNGFITDVQEYADEERGGYTLVFTSVQLDENSNIVSEETTSITLFSGVDGRDGEDAEPFVLSVRQDAEDGRWYWYDVQADDWMYSLDGKRFLVDGKDGITPQLKVEEGFWCISWDGGETWETTEWRAKGDEGQEFFSKAEVFDDRIELTMAADSSVIALPRYVKVDVSLSIDGEELAEVVPIVPGSSVSIAYTLTGTGAENAVLAAGTDGRLKTAIRQVSSTEGFVDVTCPEVFPEGGYIYITVVDSNGKSTVKVIKFTEASGQEGSGEVGGNEGGSGASGEGGQEGE